MDRILVGVDGSDTSEDALHWAVKEARSHGARVVAVLVVEPSYLYGVELPSVAPDREPVEEAEAELERIVAGALRGEESVDVERRVEVSGDPREILRELSSEVDLLVVGSRGHGGIQGLVLGSVGQYLVTHAHCPVTIVRPRA